MYFMSQTKYYSLDAGKNAVKKNLAWGLLYFPKNYTISMNERIMLERTASKTSVKFSEVQIWLDMSSKCSR